MGIVKQFADRDWVLETVLQDEVTPIEKGGTGATTSEEACANLGALRTSGGTLTGSLKVSVGSDNRHINIGGTASNIKFYQTDTGGDWGTGVLMRNSDDSATLGAYGFRLGAGDVLRYYYIGTTSDAPLFKMDASGTITLATALPVTAGGTGAKNKADARTNLGIESGTSLPESGTVGDLFFLHS